MSVVPPESDGGPGELPAPVLQQLADELLGRDGAVRDQALQRLQAAHPEHAAALAQAAADLAATEALLGEGFASAGDPLPAHLGPYEVVRQLGEGAFGAVFLCRQVAPVERHVAVKVLRPGVADRHLLARFAVERQLLAALGAGVAGTVRALLAMPDGSLIAGGDFATAGGVPASRIARWNGVAWAPLGFGTNQSVRALVRLPNGDVVAGGLFSVAGGQPAARIARWDGTTWSALGAGMNDLVTALAARPDGRVIAGGRFTTAGGANIFGVAEWNGTAWSPFGVGLSDVTSLAVLPNGHVFAGKELSPQQTLRRWDGVAWSVLLGTAKLQGEPSVRALAFSEAGELFVGGDFDFMSLSLGTNAGNFARLRSPCPATAVATGGGCAGSAGPVVMQATSLPWLGTTFRARTTGMPPGLGIAVTGFQSISLPLVAVLPQAGVGCTLRASPDLLDVVVPIVDAAVSQLSLPSSASLIGQQFHHQMIPLAMDPSLTITSVLASDALQLTIGDL